MKFSLLDRSSDREMAINEKKGGRGEAKLLFFQQKANDDHPGITTLKSKNIHLFKPLPCEICAWTPIDSHLNLKRASVA